MNRSSDLLSVLVFGFGALCGMSFAGADAGPDLRERKAVIDCMSEVGYEAADPNASRLEQLHQSQIWCEQFMRQRPQLRDAAQT